MFKFNNKSTRTMSLTPFSSVSIVDFEQVNIGWVHIMRPKEIVNIIYTMIPDNIQK